MATPRQHPDDELAFLASRILISNTPNPTARRNRWRHVRMVLLVAVCCGGGIAIAGYVISGALWPSPPQSADTSAEG